MRGVHKYFVLQHRQEQTSGPPSFVLVPQTFSLRANMHKLSETHKRQFRDVLR